MKKFKYFLWIFFLQTSPVLAKIDDPENPGNKLPTGLKGIITTVSNTLLMLVGVVAVLFVIIGGFQYISSAGNPENVGKAKQTILYAIIGIIITIIAYAVVSFVISNIK